MITGTTVKGFNTLKNQILGRLSQCMDPDELQVQMKIELLKLLPDRKPLTKVEQAALIGVDISEGITAANQAIAGDTDKIDDL